MATGHRHHLVAKAATARLMMKQRTQVQEQGRKGGEARRQKAPKRSPFGMGRKY